MTVLISAAELRTMLANANPPAVLDVRWSLDQPDGSKAFRTAHIPGAVYVSLDDELASHGDPTDGRHPLPSREALQAAARGWGLNNGDAVVVYDAGPSLAAARAWWLLKHAGVADVKILDGGLAAWVAQGGPTEQGPVQPAFGDVELSWDALPVIDVDGAAAFPGTGLLLDARAPERYRGEIEPVDPVAGHIPGAVNAPTVANVGPDGTFLSVAELQDRFASLGVTGDTPLAVYCGSGVTAAHEIAALEIAGFAAALYPGSWSQWSNLELPVAIGEGARVRS
jgi:thiosulfate/3-mercaptopyruvate sulfurtransferase